MAQMVETMSVYAADMRLKKPRVIPRPGDVVQAPTQAQVKEDNAAAHGGLLTAAMMRGKVISSAPVGADA